MEKLKKRELVRLFKTICFMGLISLSFQIHAVECYITLIKDQCWKDYQVHLNIIDMSTHTNQLEIDLPKGEMWTRKKFDCQPGQIFNKSASFSPAIWQGDEQKEFASSAKINLPPSAPKEGAIWSIDICFPEGFSKVPTPVKDVGHCGCDKTNIPELKNTNVVQH
jgi:hypothetical protein